MQMLDRLHKGKVFMSESQSAMHKSICLCKTCVNRWTLEGIEPGETKEYRSYSDNMDTTESTEEESIST